MWQYLIPFGVGHRACIGRNIATTEICKLVGSILKRYDLEYRPQAGGGEGQMPPTISFGITDLEGKMMVKVHRRGLN